MQKRLKFFLRSRFNWHLQGGSEAHRFRGSTNSQRFGGEGSDIKKKTVNCPELPIDPRFPGIKQSKSGSQKTSRVGGAVDLRVPATPRASRPPATAVRAARRPYF